MYVYLFLYFHKASFSLFHLSNVIVFPYPIYLLQPYSPFYFLIILNPLLFCLTLVLCTVSLPPFPLYLYLSLSSPSLFLPFPSGNDKNNSNPCLL